MSEREDTAINEAPVQPAKGALAPLISGVVLLIGAGILAFGLLGDGQGSSAPKAGGRGRGGAHGGGGGKGKAKAGVPVRVGPVTVGELSTERRVPGELTAERRAALHAEVGGQVKQVPHRLGAIVKSGALLVSIDPGALPAEVKRADAAADVAKARAEKSAIVTAKAKRDLERREALAKEGAVSAGELDQARTDLQTAEVDQALAAAEARRADADGEALRVKLSKTRVHAPFAGRVAKVHVDTGTVVSPGTLLVEFIDNNAPIVRFSVSEGEAFALPVGTLIDVHTAKAKVQAKIQRVGAALDTSTRTLPMEATLEEEAEHALPGMFVEVALSASSPSGAPLVPLAALVGKGARRQAFVVDDDSIAHATDVVVLLHDGQQAAVRGLAAGQTIVIEGAAKARDGEKVEVVQ